MVNRVRIGKIVVVIVVGILLSTIAAAVNSGPSVGSPQFPVGAGSWNPRVPCSSPWIVRITDITDNMTGAASHSGSIFNPGDPNKRWLTPGATPPGWVSPGPPCTISNSHGTVSMFVEIDGVMRESPVNEDCTGTYDTSNGGGSNGGSFCDTTFNIRDPSIVPTSGSCNSSSDPTCYGKVHSEIDHDWKAAHYCGSLTTCDDAAITSQITPTTLIDVQGFVYWDPDHLTVSWHSFNGWELHPFTAWRLHQSNPRLVTSFTFSPSSPTIGQSVTFTASTSGGTSPYSYSWSFGDGTSSTGTPVSHSYTSAGTFTVQLLVADSAGANATSSHTITVTQPPPPDFTIISNPSTLQIVPGGSGSSTITMSSTAGFAGTITLSTNISPSGPSISLSLSSVTLGAGGTGTSALTVTMQSSTSIGNYTVTVTGNSGSLSHSTTVLVMVRLAPDFSLTPSSSLISVPRTSSGTITLSLLSLNGFSGTISLSVTVSPAGPKASLGSPTITLTPGGSASDPLTIRALKKTAVGSYVVTITATSGTTTHSTTVTVIVT